MVGGVPLFLLWCAIWLMPVVDAFRQNRQILPAAAPIAIVVSAFVALTFTSLVDRNMSWMMVALGFSVACIQISRKGRRLGLAEQRELLYQPLISSGTAQHAGTAFPQAEQAHTS